MSLKKIIIIILFQFFIFSGQGFNLNYLMLYAKGDNKALKCKKQGGKWIKNQCMIYAGGLYWEKNVTFLNWHNAKIYCKRKGLRLPTLKELRAGCGSGLRAFKILPKKFLLSSTVRDTYRVWALWSSHCGTVSTPKVSRWHARCVTNK